MGSGRSPKTQLGRMHDIVADYVEHGEVPDIVTLVSRRDEVYVDALGCSRGRYPPPLIILLNANRSSLITVTIHGPQKSPA